MPSSDRPRVTGVVETALHVDDVERSALFYQELFGLEAIEGDERFRALSVAGRQLLLLFRKGTTQRPIELPGGVIPPHGGEGDLHVAFSIPAADLESWEARLAARGVAIEGRMRWPRGGASLYFRDPDGHMLELVTPGCWSIY